MQNVSHSLASGEKARLIPVVADTSKENRATSILLSTIMSVEALAKSLLGSIGQRLGSRTKVECFTEVVFKNSPANLNLRPDGLLTLTVGKRSWRALFEAKIGKALLDETQIAGYCQLAKLNGVDAVITLSNQFAALPTHHPVKLPRSVTRGVELYHWSWMSILTQATLLLHEDEFSSEEQRYLLSEMVRYFSHDSVGVSSFDRMNSEWKDLVTKVQSGAALSKTSTEVENSVAAWHQEQRDICLLMSRKLGRQVTLSLPRTHSNDQARRLKDDCEAFVDSHNLSCTLSVPDAAAPLTIGADVGRRTVTCAMRIDAPRDKKRTRSRINWVVRQLSKTEPSDIFVKALWPGRARDTQAKLEELRENPDLLDSDNSSRTPWGFEVIMVRDLAGKFSGSRTFIEHLETAVPEYYENVGQHLRAWVAQPPKMVEKHPEAIQPQNSPKDELGTEGSQSQNENKKEHVWPWSTRDTP